MTKKVGDRYRPIVTVLKTKNNTPSVIKVSGREYVWRPKDMHQGGKR